MPAALIVALLALAGVAWTALAGRSRLAAQRRILDGYAARLADRENRLQALQHEISYARKDLVAAKQQFVVSRENVDAEAARYTERVRELRPAVDARFTLADTDAVQAGHRLTELEQYVVGSLEQEAAVGVRSRILRGSLFARQCAVLDLIPELVADLLADLGASTVYRHPAGPNGCRFYLRWPPDAPVPDLRLGSRLRAATAAVAPSAEPGTTQLRSVLHAVHEGGPAVLHLGPLVICRTADRMSAGLAPHGWPGLAGSAATAAIDGTAPDLLKSIGASGIADLTGWPVSP